MFMSGALLIILKKALALILSLITPLLFGIHWEPLSKYDKDCRIVEEKIGGFMKGVCHADPDYDTLKGANIEWTRKDIPFPYNKDGSLSQSYINWKAEMKAYSDNGGISRGSGLYTENGVPVPESDTDPNEDKVQMVRYIDGRAEVTNRSVIPLPEEDDFFENVWRDFRNNLW
jgi:hypothetical protein